MTVRPIDARRLPTACICPSASSWATAVYLSAMPNLMYFKDTNGDDRADTRDLIMHGFDTADSHHALHALTWDPGGGLYWQRARFITPRRKHLTALPVQ